MDKPAKGKVNADRRSTLNRQELNNNDMGDIVKKNENTMPMITTQDVEALATFLSWISMRKQRWSKNSTTLRN